MVVYNRILPKFFGILKVKEPNITTYMDYQETLTYLFSQLPIFQRTGSSAYKSDLSNTLKMDERLGHPHKQFKTIHIAGTNGKGSVSHLLASVLQSAGYKTGLYTSPHLTDFRERIRIDGKMVSESFVVSFVNENRVLIEEVKPSFFEMTVAMAFDYFAMEKVDVAVIEVGLGGRLDSTNIIRPDLSVITNISLDHVGLLGQSLQLIAVEKGGIIKEKVPVVLGRRQPEVSAVFENIAQEKKAPLWFADETYPMVKAETEGNDQWITLSSSQEGSEPLSFKLPLAGFYQQENLRTVLAAVIVLRIQGYHISEGQLQQGVEKVVQQTGLAGRWQKIGEHPLVVCDVAHNQDGIRFVVNQLKTLRYDVLHIVFGMVNDKDIDSVLSLMPTQARYYFTQASIPRALHHATLKKKALTYGLEGDSYENVPLAFAAAKKNAGCNDAIFVGGSTFVVAEVLEK